MRDVIVIGAGGGGPVVAKELAGADSTCWCSRRVGSDSPRREWTHFEIEPDSSGDSGLFRFGPGDRTKPAWSRELPQN